MFRVVVPVLVSLSLLIVASAQDTRPVFPGPNERGFLLPNGWTISPAGKQVVLTDLPLNILPSADSKTAVVATSGFNAHELSRIDLETGGIVSRQVVRQSWYGLAPMPDGKGLYWSGGGAALVHKINDDGKNLAREGDPEPVGKDAAARTKGHFISGLAVHPTDKSLYTLDIEAGTLSRQSAEPGQEAITRKVAQKPYDVILNADGSKLYVSDWADKCVLELEPTTLETRARVTVGEHPNQIAIHPKDGRVFVACASSNSVSVTDPATNEAIESVVTSLFPRAPEGSTPDALALSPDGKTLYVANADNNCVAVIDVEFAKRSQVKGFIPTGWYPTSVAVTPDGKTLLVGVGKGNQTRANPISKTSTDNAAANKGRPFPYIGTTLSGALSIVAVPDDKELAAYTETVYKNCPYSDKQLTDAPSPRKTAIPTRVGDPSPIKYVMYIIKENRTYDQVFGDMDKGNGDPSLCMFPRQVTPNHHKLAEEFVLLDNLYCNGHVSADGHPWSTAAYNTDYIARNWALGYSGRVNIRDDDDGDLARPPSGYLWDACNAAGLSYRSYGEYGRRVSEPDGSFRMEGSVPGLVGHFCSQWGLPKPDGTPVRDTDRVETFLRELRDFEKNGDLPRFSVMSLGEDHTTGTRPGTFTPQACVASNDLALGRMVEALSKSRFWPELAIFVIEDDAQNGPDHVDAHRTVGLVISPYARRGHLDSTQYGGVSMIRTMELILGLKPLSQYDAAANPMFGSFNEEAVLTPYVHEPARIDLQAKNTPLAYGADRSSKMDFTEYDKIDDFELNEILWKSIMGKDAPIPPAVRRAIAFKADRRHDD